MKISTYSLLFLIYFSCSVSQVFGINDSFKVSKLSPYAKISLLTVGRSDAEVWQKFGHTAIRINDSINGWDIVYNYGTFSFGNSESEFVWNFVKGRLLYYLTIDMYPDFIAEYIEENRSVSEQILNLDTVQKQKLFEALTFNAREENKYYKYDFLFDNCSTRPRDKILSLFNTVQFQKDADDDVSYRKLIRKYANDPWLDFGMDLLIGARTDKKAGFGRTFLPDELMQSFDGATADGKKLTLSNRLILDTVPEHMNKSRLTPTLVFWFLFLVLFLLQIYYQLLYRYKIIPVIYLCILGLFGWLFIFMWFFTDHKTTKYNLNILWAMPLLLPFIVFHLKKSVPNAILIFTKIYRVLLIFLIMLWWLNPQKYNIAVLPLILLAILSASVLLPIPKSGDFSKRLFP